MASRELVRDPDAALRQELIAGLNGGNAHARFEDVVDKFPTKLRGEKAGLPYSAWQLLEHIRIAQDDILRFCMNHDGSYKEMKFPNDYWPRAAVPPVASAWDNSIASVVSDRDRMVKIVGDPRYNLTAPFPWAEGQNLVREAILMIDHNSYHVGEILTLRRLLGIWPAR